VSFCVGAQRRFAASFGDLDPGPHRLEARAVDDRGNEDATPPHADVTVAPASSPIGATVRGDRTVAGTARIVWEAAAGAVSYRVLRAAAPSGSWSPAGTTASTGWTDALSGDGYFVVRGIDACGVEGSE
jgi:hypothetical protein